MVYVTVACDVCGMEESNPAPVAHAERMCRDAGWRVNGRTHYALCSECVWDATHGEEAD